MSSYSRFSVREWDEINIRSDAVWEDDAVVSEGMAVRLETAKDGSTQVLAADFTRLGDIEVPLNPARRGLTIARVKGNGVSIDYLGPDALEAAA